MLIKDTFNENLKLKLLDQVRALHIMEEQRHSWLNV